jgi:hypothetical protein
LATGSFIPYKSLIRWPGGRPTVPEIGFSQSQLNRNSLYSHHALLVVLLASTGNCELPIAGFCSHPDLVSGVAWQLFQPTFLANNLSMYASILQPILPNFADRIVSVAGAGISDTSTTNRTLWPLDGGSLNVTLHDDAAYIFINIGLGVNTTNFNITLFSQPLNETGAGNLCFPKLVLPPELGIEEGTAASIQFATAGHNGEGLYNVRNYTG